MGERFDWNHPGLSWSHFHSVANLLSLRNDGQAEPSSLSDTVLEDGWDPEEDNDEETRSVNTMVAHKISSSGHERLKKRFLDSLAEFAANKKGGTAVACTAMKEAEDSVTIWIARNQGFSDADQCSFDNFAEAMSVLSGDKSMFKESHSIPPANTTFLSQPD